jgi:hypothetical protein
LAYDKQILGGNLQQRANGMKMVDVMNQQSITQWIKGFVDDTSIFTNTNFVNNNICELKDKLKYDGQYWAGLLEASGGRLELVKCFYYLLTWKWDKKGNPSAASIIDQYDNQHNICLTINEDPLSNTPLNQRDIHQCHKTLGAFKRISGKEIDHEKYLREKSDKYAVIVCHSKLNRTQARLAYNSCYIPALTYSSTSVAFEESILNRIQQNAITQFIRKLGFEQCFPRAVVYGPSIFGGLGIQQLYSTSMCTKIETIICHINSNSSLGTVFGLILDWLQLHAGTSKLINTCRRIGLHLFKIF